MGIGCQAVSEAAAPPHAAHHRIPLPLQESQYRAIVGERASSFREAQIAHLRLPQPPPPPRVVIRTRHHWPGHYPYYPGHPFYWGRRGWWPHSYSHGTLVP